MATIEIRVREADSGREVFPARDLTLPVRFGRSGDDSYGRLVSGDGEKLGFGSGYETLSREHFEISASGDEVSLTDLSSNGMEMVAGGTRRDLGQGQRVRLPRETVSQLESCGLRFDLRPRAGAESFGRERITASYQSSSGEFKSVPLGPDSVAIILDGERASVAAFPGRTAADVRAALERAGDNWAAVVGPGDGGVVAIIAPGMSGTVAVNRVPTEDKTQMMEHFDTVQVGRFDLRMLEDGGPPALECTNPACRMLNSYHPTDNCKYCGTKLGEARTRVIRRS